jgi:hypothetical protein
MHEGEMHNFLIRTFQIRYKYLVLLASPGSPSIGCRKRRSPGNVIIKKYPGNVLEKFVAGISLFSKELNLTKTMSVLHLSTKRWTSLYQNYSPLFPDTFLR